MDSLLAAVATALALVFGTLWACRVFPSLTGQRQTPEALKDGGLTPIVPSVPPAVAEFEKRLAAVELSLPEHRIAMANLADEVEDMLGRAESRRRRTQMQANRLQGPENARSETIEELANRDPEAARSAIKARSRLLNGGGNR